jgi:hypothetical protein
MGRKYTYRNHRRPHYTHQSRPRSGPANEKAAPFGRRFVSRLAGKSRRDVGAFFVAAFRIYLLGYRTIECLGCR